MVISQSETRLTTIWFSGFRICLIYVLESLSGSVTDQMKSV